METKSLQSARLGRSELGLRLLQRGPKGGHGAPGLAARLEARRSRPQGRRRLDDRAAPLRRARPGPRGVLVHRVPVTRTPWFEEAARALLARAGGVDLLYAVHYRCGLHAARIARRTRSPSSASSRARGSTATSRSCGPSDLGEIRTLERYVCMTGALKDEAIAHGLDPGKIVSLPNGVDLNGALGRAARGEGPRPLRGAAQPPKELDVLLRAIEQVKGARLEVAGVGEEESAQEARARSSGSRAGLVPRGAERRRPAPGEGPGLRPPLRGRGAPERAPRGARRGDAFGRDLIPGNQRRRPSRERSSLGPAPRRPVLARAIERLLQTARSPLGLGEAGRRASPGLQPRDRGRRALAPFHGARSPGRLEARPWRAGRSLGACLGQGSMCGMAGATGEGARSLVEDAGRPRPQGP